MPYAPSLPSGLMATAVTGADTGEETSFADQPQRFSGPWRPPPLPCGLGIGGVSCRGRAFACGAEDYPGWPQYEEPQQQAQVQMQEEEQSREMQQGQHHHHRHQEPRSRAHWVEIRNEARGVEARGTQEDTHGLKAPAEMFGDAAVLATEAKASTPGKIADAKTQVEPGMEVSMQA
ncbi:hypothetical protein Vafri_260, partial [Volvox africanus]